MLEPTFTTTSGKSGYLFFPKVIGKIVKAQGWNRKENCLVTKSKEALNQVLKSSHLQKLQR
jgi:hypothetical protein